MGGRRPRPGPPPRVAGLLLLVLTSLASLASCEFPPGTLVQGGGLPSLRHLDWGYAYYEAASWSPNGRWIALSAGPGVAQTHLVVLSPDGRYHRDLSAWGCDDAYNSYLFSIAWLPDSSLSCISDNGKLVIGAYPFTAPSTVLVQPLLQPLLTPGGKGAAWTPQGTALIVASLTDPTDPVHEVKNGALYLVDRDGTISLQSLTPRDQYVEDPAWAPHRAALSYAVETDPNTGTLNLLLSAVTFDAKGGVTLGPPQTLARDVDSYYVWSPTGRWVAVRYANYQGGDKIYLLNPDDPTQTVDVVLADRVGQQMMQPIWSPDGNTLIVFSVAFNASQPYQLDIGAYLRSKGMQP